MVSSDILDTWAWALTIHYFFELLAKRTNASGKASLEGAWLGAWAYA